MSKPNLLAIWAKQERGEGATNEELGHLIERFESLHDHAEQAEQAAARVREVHRPVDIEPSNTICGGCSTLRGEGENMRYFPVEEWPCDTIRALDGEQG